MLNLGDFVTAKPQLKKNFGKPFAGLVYNLSVKDHAYVLDLNNGNVILYHIDELKRTETSTDESMRILDRWTIHVGDLVCSTPNYEQLYKRNVFGEVQSIQPDLQVVVVNETELFTVCLFHLKKIYNVRPMLQDLFQKYQKKVSLLEQIDECLDNRNESEFYALTNEWKVYIEDQPYKNQR